MPTTHLCSRWGDKTFSNPSEDQMSLVLAELVTDDDEHPDCALSDENGWTLSVFQGGSVVFENVESDDEPKHLRLGKPEDAIRLWRNS